MAGWRSRQKGNLIKFNKGKCIALHLGRNNPRHQYLLGSDHLGISSAEKDLGVLVDSKLTVSQQRALTARNARPVASWAASGVLTAD